MPEESFKARFTGQREERPGIATFFFLPEKKIEFKPGQFAFLNFELRKKRHSKHFTIASSPARKKIEFTTMLSKSPYKKALSKMPLGTQVGIGKPMGEFTIGARKTDKIAFLAGGIGITPIRSILESLSKGMKELEIVIFYSNRNQERIVFREKLEEMAEKLGFVQVVHTLTDLSEEEKGNWVGETGFIDRKMVKRHVENEQDYTFFVVGPPKFNKAMKKMLLEDLCVKEEMIVEEAFSGY